MTCPICGAETVVKYRPFCSKRCSDLDLARWLNGSYAIPSTGDEDQSAEEEQGLAPDRRH
ncbi:DNA gyrase inhibitor YacG [Ruegeria marina]|uniref:DNA gyrase inhibitor YacG n=1 Tax=Ruegeria marina TaxID=639004 RepID=UPI000B813F64|nr:DNA gyrase inhibitor YacG [Ruegeria marina]